MGSYDGWEFNYRWEGNYFFIKEFEIMIIKNKATFDCAKKQLIKILKLREFLEDSE